MRRFVLIVAALVLLSIVEIGVLIAVGEVIGLGAALLILLATSVLGGALLRSQGGRAWRAFRADLQASRPPGRAATDGLLVALGGVLMLVPGFITDLVGLLFLLPPTRRLPRALLMRVVANNLSPAAATSLFGPRRVRVRYGRGQHSHGAGQRDANSPGGDRSTQNSPAIEGDIIEPDR